MTKQLTWFTIGSRRGEKTRMKMTWSESLLGSQRHWQWLRNECPLNSLTVGSPRRSRKNAAAEETHVEFNLFDNIVFVLWQDKGTKGSSNRNFPRSYWCYTLFLSNEPPSPPAILVTHEVFTHTLFDEELNWSLCSFINLSSRSFCSVDEETTKSVNWMKGPLGLLLMPQNKERQNEGNPNDNERTNGKHE